MQTQQQPLIPLIRPSMPLLGEYISEISDLWDSRILTNMARKHQALESALQTYLDAQQFQLFVNGHQALEIALQALGLTGEVITTPFTFASTTHAIVRRGLTPVFCDVREEDYTLDPALLESLITEKTTAIVPVHVYGMACDVESIQRIADKYRLKVIYDAAHAFGVRVNGRGIGSYGDVSMFSFHATKAFHTIEGGGLAYRDPALGEMLLALKDFGILRTDEVVYVGGNSKMDEFRAAMGLCNLRAFDAEVQKRRLAAERYDERLAGVAGIRRLPVQPGVTRTYAYYPIVLDGYRKTREQLFAELRANQIITRRYFYPLCTDYPCYRERFGCASVPVAARVAAQVLCLPMFAGLTREEVDRVCDVILG